MFVCHFLYICVCMQALQIIPFNHIFDPLEIMSCRLMQRSHLVLWSWVSLRFLFVCSVQLHSPFFSHRKMKWMDFFLQRHQNDKTSGRVYATCVLIENQSVSFNTVFYMKCNMNAMNMNKFVYNNHVGDVHCTQYNCVHHLFLCIFIWCQSKQVKASKQGMKWITQCNTSERHLLTS